jgi:protein-S-isoprenylcysteine O-methyltransferase Ste14
MPFPQWFASAPSMVPARSSLSQVQQVRKRVLWLSLLPLIALFFTVTPLWREGSAFEESIEILAFGLIALAVLGRTWCTLYIGGRKKREIVDTGPYSLSRNPLYVFSVVGALGIGMTTGSLGLGLLLAGFTFLVFDRVVRREEGWLAARFGEAYVRYRARTPRWLSPRACWRDAERLEVRPRLVLTTFRDASLMLLALPLVEAVEELHILWHLPALLQLP